ncbi:inositol monophosphatase family protein [Sphingobium sp. CR28]|uniref:inositol monophosphatase family protein n=1 Tax=Sphingobium sp. CR28 TaxID=3400272 RepID=UPI003FF0AA8B
MRRVAADIVMPRYQNLASHEISEKAADDLVTIADKESEIALADGLASILPEAAIVGEEAVAADASVLERLGAGTQWIIDPIDGTGNFAAGRPPFGLMIALVADGEMQAGWLLDPLTGRLCHAALGGGAFVNGDRIAARGTGVDLPVAGLSVLFMNPADRAEALRRAEGKLTMMDIPRCAAEQYPRIVLGVNDVAVFERTLPWDHAPGALFVNEAGGKVARPDGSPYRIGADAGRGLIAACSPAMWDRAADILYR